MTQVLFVLRIGLCLLLSLQLALPARVIAGQDQNRGLKMEILAQVKRKSTLWVLAIGVSKYADDRISLELADHDAIGIAKLLSSQQGVLFDEVKTMVLVNEQATRAGILNAMGSFLSQASQKDVVLIFLAGHGIQHRQTGTYYFLPHNANADNVLVEGLLWPVFEENCKLIQQQVDKLMLWLDTCHAGAVNVATRGVNVGEDLAAALSEASGKYVLSASKAGQESLESDSLRFKGENRGHGVFSYSILKGLQGAAADTAGIVWLSDLFGYVNREVPRKTLGKQQPYGSIVGTDLPIFVVNEGRSHGNDGGSYIPPPPPKSKIWIILVTIVALLGGGGVAVVVSDSGDDGSEPTIPRPPAHP